MRILPSLLFLVLGLLSAALGLSPTVLPDDCFTVEYLGSTYYAASDSTVFTYELSTSSESYCKQVKSFSILGSCPSAQCPDAPDASPPLEDWAWNFPQNPGTTQKYHIYVPGRVNSVTTGQWLIKTEESVSVGYTCVPDCPDQEPTRPNVGEPCELVIPASITLPNTGRVQVQVSLQAVPDGEVTVAITSDCAFLTVCTLTFNPTNWNVPQIFRASNDPSNPDRTCNINLVATGTNDCEGTINVTKADAPRTESVSYGDPYVFTFDGVRFRLTQTTSGDDYYYLLRQPDGELIVQTYVVPCAIGECNRGVAIRYRTAVFFLDMASNGATTPSDNGLLALEGIVVTQPAAGAYLLSLNSQAAIRLTPELIASMNVYSLRVSIRLGTYYRSNVAGLVGNYNSNRNDERRLPDGTQAPDLPTFENGWKVPPAEVLFNNPAAPIGTLFGAQPYTSQTFPFVCEAS